MDLTYRYAPLGIWVVDMFGDLVDPISWNDGSNATGVAVITDEVRLIVAPDEWYNSGDVVGSGYRSAWGGYNKTVSNIVTNADSSIAITDFAGSSNTDQIIAQLKGSTDIYSEYYTGAPAAEYCRAYSKGCKGVGEWYLPAAGEMNIIAQNKDTINAALTKISGETLGKYGYTYTSTQYNAYGAWRCDWSDGSFSYDDKHRAREVRPVCQL